MECPYCHEESGDQRRALIITSRFPCRACGQALYAEQVKEPAWKTIAFLIVMVIVAGAITRATESYAEMGVLLSLVIIGLLAAARFLRRYRLRSAADVGPKIIRRDEFRRYGFIVLTLAFAIGALAYPLEAFWPRLVQFALMAVALVLFAVAEPERL